jgi:hypothetical protein
MSRRWHVGLIVSVALVVIACSGAPVSDRPDTPPAGSAIVARDTPTAIPKAHRSMSIPALTPEQKQAAEAFFTNQTI